MEVIKSPVILGALIRETRTAQNITAENLAEIVNTSPVTLRKIEQGRSTEAIKTLFNVLDELGIVMRLDLPYGVNIPEIKNINKTRRTRVKP